VPDLRVLYDVDEDEELVDILVVGRKLHASFLVAGREVKL
jgi:2-phospho-L-lactate guanylyltransferase (CobY/MobA/RfbA family)